VGLPVHIVMRLDRYKDSYEQNAKAVEADEGYLTTCSAQGVYHDRNLALRPGAGLRAH